MPNLDLPEEKESKKEEKEKEEQKHNQTFPSNSKIEILQGKLQNGELIHLVNSIDSNDEDGLVALGISRKQICEAFLARQDDKECRRILSEEIGDAVIANEIIINDAALQALKEKYNNEQTSLKTLVKEIKQSSQPFGEVRGLSADKLVDWLLNNGYHDKAKSLERKNSEFRHSKDQLDDFCQRLEIFQSYIKSIDNGLKIGIKSVILYAKLANITLYIWRKDIKIEYKLELFHFCKAEFPEKTIHLFHFGNSTYFKLLTVADKKTITERFQRRKEPKENLSQSLSINADAKDNDSDDEGNDHENVNTESSKLSRAYSWVSRLWNRHEIPTKFLLKPASNNLGWVNFVMSFTQGARVLRDLWPPVLLSLFAHDFIVYGNQPDDRYGATAGNILHWECTK